jgi:beta-fructofuranosidase
MPPLTKHRVMRISIFFLLLSYGLFAQSPVVQFSFDENTGDLMAIDSANQALFSVVNHFGNPERMDAPQGRALRLDGYSTWAENAAFSVPNVTDRMAVEIWYATEAFNEKPVGLISQITGSSGFALKVHPYGRVLFQLFADGQAYFLETVQELETYQWNHIVAQVDLADQVAEIWVNGELWATKVVGTADQLTFSSAKFYLGRGSDAPMFDQFLLSVANGALDEVRIFNQTFSPAEITSRFNAIGLVETELAIDPDIRHAGDHLRPRYHVMPNTAWTNESYGLTYFNGKYHLFSQKNPNSPTLYFMHWGHYSSPDLVSWKEERIALSPKPGFSDFGVWSGTTVFNDEGQPVILYTGVNGQIAGIGAAYPLDDELIKWELEPGNPVIPAAPNNIPNLDFRDPYVWKGGDFFYMIVGSGRAGNNGGILMSYRSADLVEWEQIDPIFESGNIQESGIFWEMPAMILLDSDHWMFVVTPVFSGNPARTLYWIGDFSGEKFVPYHESPKRFEHLARLLLSPAFGLDEEGRWTYIGIIPEDRSAADQIAAGWRQVFSLPRVARILDDGNIGHYPHPNLCRLRQAQTTIENRTISHGSNFNLPEIQGDQYEIEMTLVPEENAEFSLQLFKNEQATMFTSIYGDVGINRLGINRQLSSPYQTTEDNRFATYVFRDTVHLRVFADHSMVEVFVDNLTVMSARVYPGEDQKLIDLVVPEGSVTITRLDFWEMGDKEDSYPAEVCEPAFLPSSFLSSSAELFLPEGQVLAYPNPVSDSLSIEVVALEMLPPFAVTIWNSGGQEQMGQIMRGNSGAIDVSQLTDGVYFLKLTDKERTAVIKFIKKAN